VALLDNLEKNLTDLLISLSDNDNFIKLVSIDNPNALNQSPSDNFYSLFNERLFLKPKVNMPTSEEETYICIYMGRAERAGGTSKNHNDIPIVIDIMTHLNLWDLEDNKIRPYRIVDIIYDNFMETKVKSVRGNLEFNNAELIRYNEKFMGYRMFFMYTGSKGC
jgi:hypothetical protein